MGMPIVDIVCGEETVMVDRGEELLAEFLLAVKKVGFLIFT